MNIPASTLLVSIYVHLMCETACDDVTVHSGGWYEDKSLQAAEDGPCNIDLIHSSSVSQHDFIEKYAFTKPVIIKLSRNVYADDFYHQCKKQNILDEHGEKIVRLSTANTYSYQKRDVPLREYIEMLMKKQTLNMLGNETFYYFGDNNHTEWKEMFDVYKLPPYTLPGKLPALSFGIAAAGTGVPFHFHGPGFAEVIYGKKRWFLYPPHQQPTFNPDKSTLHWAFHDLSNLSGAEIPLQCTISQGEIIYFPDHWWHATLNLHNSVFISTFLG